MKITYVAHFKEGGGWSRAATDYVLCLDKTGVDVACVDIKLTNKQCEIHNKILELESKDPNGRDIVVQHVLPHHFVKHHGKKNILYLAFETNTIQYSGWKSNVKMADEVWVPNKELQQSLIEDGIKNVKYIPHTFDLSKYKEVSQQIDLSLAKYAFKFYTIIDLNDRKNLDSILRCFHSEFYREENVALIIKASKYGVDPNALRSMINAKSEQIRKTMRIHKNVSLHRPEYIITEYLPDEIILGLHNTCDCFLNPSHGEGWSIPSFEAMCFGNTPICSNQGGPKDFINSEDSDTGSLINGIHNICYHSDPAFPSLFTGKEFWFVPSEKEIKEKMRFYYETRDKTDKTKGMKQAENFSYENVGQLILNTLQE